MTFLSPNLGHISFLQGVVIAQKYREFIVTTEFFSPKKTDSLNFKSIKKFNGTLRLPTNGTLNPKLRGVFFLGGPWVKRSWKVDLTPGCPRWSCEATLGWRGWWLNWCPPLWALHQTWIGSKRCCGWVPKGHVQDSNKIRGSWGKDGKMKSVKSMNIFNEWFFFAGTFIFFVGMLKGYTMQRKRKLSCCLVADSSLFGDTNLIKGWEWVGVTMVFLLIPAFDHIDLAIPVHLIKAVGNDTFTSSRRDVLITTQAVFCQKKTRACAFGEKKRTTPRWWALFHSLPGGCLRGFIRTAYWSEGRSGVPDRQVHGRKRLLLFSPKYTEHVVPAEKPHCASEG